MLIRKERIPVLQILFVGLLPSFLKVMVYRLRGYVIGKGVSIGFGSVLMGDRVTIGDGVSIGFFTIIRGKSVTINRYVKIGSMSVIDTGTIFIDDDARINEQVYIGGMKTPQSEIRLGKRTIIMQLSYLNPTLPIVIGDDTGIGGHCLLFTHGSWNDQLEGFPVKFAPITLGKKVWLPWRVFIMPGVTMGDNIVIGANSLITSDIPSNSLAAGNPAKVLKENYPVKPLPGQQQEMMRRVFNDFFDYLSFHEFVVDKKENPDGFHATLTGKRKSAELVYTTSPGQERPVRPDNVIVVFQASHDEILRLRELGWKMVLSPGNRLRAGQSDAGDEMAAFFSRYGTRFERIEA